MCGGGPRLAGTTVDLDPFIRVIPMMPKTSLVLPHNAPCSPFEVAHFHPQTKMGSAFTRLEPPICFYLWGYLKDNVYENNPQTIGELKAAITGKIRQIPKEECVRVIDNFARRVRVCRGQHLEHILKRT